MSFSLPSGFEPSTLYRHNTQKHNIQRHNTHRHNNSLKQQLIDTMTHYTIFIDTITQ